MIARSPSSPPTSCHTPRPSSGRRTPRAIGIARSPSAGGTGGLLMGREPRPALPDSLPGQSTLGGGGRMIELFQITGSASFAARMALEEAGAEYQEVNIHPRRRDEPASF